MKLHGRKQFHLFEIRTKSPEATAWKRGMHSHMNLFNGYFKPMVIKLGSTKISKEYKGMDRF